ncbi:McrC family protein [Macrococcoides bohemicum]|uniref:McrC family protein n=1 Tax=Macrococcoides bohemicum TaxID=1903056 RepID=UPI0028A2AAB5|nr:McrC family protein [Macrococcus bohemicus]
MNKIRNITITEYGRIYAGDVINNVQITKEDINELKLFIDENNEKDKSLSSIEEYLKPIRNGVQANNFVGVLRTKSGLTIEILPKIANGQHDLNDVKKLFIKMLSKVKQINGKAFEMTHLSINDNSLIEIFIAMFLQEVNEIIKRGLKSDYIVLEQNESYLKGKLNIQKQIQLNSFNKTRFHSKFDEFDINIPENQIIKSTLLFLKKESINGHNQKMINMYLHYFDSVSSIRDVDNTFKKIKKNREYAYYDQSIIWAEIFLKRKSFTSFTGSSLAYALLFPMEKVFESYVAHMIKNHLSNHVVYLQDNRFYLFDDDGSGNKHYRLKPDIIIKNSETKLVTIVDTKWKILNATGPTQSDLYQMYAYNSRYKHYGEDVNKVILLYPQSNVYEEKVLTSKNLFADNEEIKSKIEIVYVNLFNDNWIHKFNIE